MGENYSSGFYDANYFAHGCGEPYQRNEVWLRLFHSYAERIHQDINPGKVLDAGCAMGFLVEMLRERGVEAWGIDISEYAIQNVNPEIQPYCRVGSILEPFPLPNYDLIVCIEVIEHLTSAEAEIAVKNLCEHTDDILFSSTPMDYGEVTHVNVRPPEYWAAMFYRQGFIRDVDYDASFITPWTMRFRKSQEPVIHLITNYERKLWLLIQENAARRELGIEQKKELSEKEFKYLQDYVPLQEELNEIRNSNSWKLIQRFQRLRERIFPPGSRRESQLYLFVRGLRILRKEGFLSFSRRLVARLIFQMKILTQGMRFRLTKPRESRLIEIEDLPSRPPVEHHTSSVDIIVCVHNALDDVKNCLDSVVHNTTPPFSMILIDDGSDQPTRDYLKSVAKQNGWELQRNDEACGYTFAANQGLRKSSADMVILLNSDTIVTKGWVDRMIACLQSDQRIGLVGPLSNGASWQSIPDVVGVNDWADNPLPPNVSVSQMGEWVARYSQRLYPQMTFLNGFCLLIRAEVIKEIGFFDEENFGVGYGEENDFCLRARNAGWQLALVDDTYVYHAQSRSYNHEQRKRLSQRANDVLASKHGQLVIDEGTTYLREDRVMEGIRAHSKYLYQREQLLEQGSNIFAGRRVLFVLPIWVAGGGANLIIQAARIMRSMGVDAQILNLKAHRESFENSYPGLEIPIIYEDIESIPDKAVLYEAVVATFNPTVSWIAPAVEKKPDLIVGYYIQDYEPYFYEPGSESYQKAKESYGLLSNLVRCCTTNWIDEQIQIHHKMPTTIIGASMDVDLFWPRPRKDPLWPDRPMRIAAMIRPHSERRSPHMTMSTLQQISEIYGPKVQFKLFGTKPSDPGFAPLPKDFPWDFTGELSQIQMANLLNEVDIFVDFSTFQGLGLTAMESMACGGAVIVPEKGGAITFARNDENSLVVDTSDQEACLQALRRLIDDHALRAKLQMNAIHSVKMFHPEGSTFKLLKSLFPNRD